MTQQPELASLWIGERLGPLEILSAQSFVETGNTLTIYAYGGLKDVPAGVKVANAERILSGTPILRYHGNGSPSLHSNLFRFALLAKSHEVWVDLDILARRPFSFASAFVFGWEDAEMVNTAVLDLPESSQTLHHLRAYTPNSFGYPPVMGRLQRWKFIATSLGQGLPIEKWGWGAVGPIALTHFLKRTGEVGHALPRDAFYPVHWHDAARFVTPGAYALSDVSAKTYGVHFYASGLRRLMAKKYNRQIPDGCFLAEAIAAQPKPKLRDVTFD